MAETELPQEDFEGVPKPGEVLLDKYRVERILGAGGMGVVVAATHLTLAQRVAIKFLLAKAARNPSNVARFTREAQSAARIQSEHVARVSDIGTLPSGAPYMVMEYLDGEDLAARLRRGPLSYTAAVGYLLQACEALAEAHKNGIVHRDLKPGNLFLAKRADGGERIKVLDFGISKIVVDASRGELEALTRTRTLIGSPLYMAPEQMMSAKDVDSRADIWALGVILFEMLAARPPFIGNTLPEICTRILAMPPDPLRELSPGVPPALEAAINQCLQKEPAQRLPTLVELADALAPFGDADAQRSRDTIRRVLLGAAAPVRQSVPVTIAGEPLAPVMVAAGTSEPVMVAARTGEPVSQTMNEHASKNRGLVGALIATGVLALGGVAAGFVLLREPDGETRTAASASSDPVPAAAANLQAPAVSASAPLAASAPSASTRPTPLATTPTTRRPPPPHSPIQPPLIPHRPPPPAEDDPFRVRKTPGQ